MIKLATTFDIFYCIFDWSIDTNIKFFLKKITVIYLFIDVSADPNYSLAQNPPTITLLYYATVMDASYITSYFTRLISFRSGQRNKNHLLMRPSIKVRVQKLCIIIISKINLREPQTRSAVAL